MENETKQELINYIIDALNDGRGNGVYGCDLHNELFNTDYYIIGYYQAEQWLIKNTGIFAAIDEIKEYQKDNFGMVTTDLSNSETVCNMIVYIYGEQILGELETLREKWDNKLGQDDLSAILEELNNL
jgi:hypothetical protein